MRDTPLTEPRPRGTTRRPASAETEKEILDELVALPPAAKRKPAAKPKPRTTVAAK